MALVATVISNNWPRLTRVECRAVGASSASVNVVVQGAESIQRRVRRLPPSSGTVRSSASATPCEVTGTAGFALARFLKAFEDGQTRWACASGSPLSWITGGLSRQALYASALAITSANHAGGRRPSIQRQPGSYGSGAAHIL